MVMIELQVGVVVAKPGWYWSEGGGEGEEGKGVVWWYLTEVNVDSGQRFGWTGLVVWIICYLGPKCGSG